MRIHSSTAFIFVSVFLFALCYFRVNCFKPDSDEKRSVVQIIESRGFKAETHYVTTEDGYILTIHRIVNQNSTVKVKRPVLLQHGLMSSGYDFIVNSEGVGIENSFTYYEGHAVSNNLGFALSMFDFDVWLLNSRGNLYGKNHTTLDPNDKKFWEFTFDDMVAYDLPATINYVQRATNHASVAYVGHSQGTLIMFALMSEKPEYSKIVKPFIALAPVAKVGNIKSPIRYLADNPILMDFFYYKGGVFFPSSDLIHYMGELFCKDYVIASELCSNVLFLFAGFDSRQLNLTRLPVYLAHAPATTSAWNVIHFGQLVVSNKFRKFDFGMVGNLKHYGSIHPPDYDLKKINSKNIAILTSANDWLADPKDVHFIREQLEDKLMIDYSVPYKYWNHLDFIWAKNAAKYVNVVVIDILKKFKSEQFWSDMNEV